MLALRRVTIIFYVLIFFTTGKNSLCRFVSAINSSLDISFEIITISKKSNTTSEPVNNVGSSELVLNKTIFGAIIFSDYGRLEKQNKPYKNQLPLSNLSIIRSNNARKMIKQLPFHVVHWPPVFTKSCPFTHYRHKTERGLSYAHYEIWLDFVYFDYKTLQKLALKNSSSVNGMFMVTENGTLYKNGQLFNEDDIIVIFEDDADIAVTDIVNVMKKELSNMTTDLLYLGWCDGRLARPVSLCAHAYALTRRGARLAIKYFEPCGLALDEQFVIFAKNKWLTWRNAFDSSHINKMNSEYPKSQDTTKGIFHQKRMGSFNGH
jgi:hypothetical protein